MAIINMFPSGSGVPKLQTKTVIPQSYPQAIEPDHGFSGLSSVTVNAIPDDFNKFNKITLQVFGECQSWAVSGSTVVFYSHQPPYVDSTNGTTVIQVHSYGNLMYSFTMPDSDVVIYSSEV